ERKPVEDGHIPKTNDEIPYRNDGSGVCAHLHIPMLAKKIAKRPSKTITRKIDFTTDWVVCSPSDSELPLTCRPSVHAMTPMTRAINGALIMPTLKWVTVTASCRRSM